MHDANGLDATGPREHIEGSSDTPAGAEAQPEIGKKSKGLFAQLRHAARYRADLSEGAKNLFTEITDLTFLDSLRWAEGVVKMSKTRMAMNLKSSERTVRRWTRELERTSFIWTKTIKEGEREITLWFLRGVAHRLAEGPNFVNATTAAISGWTPDRHLARLPSGKFGRKIDGGHFCPPEGSTVKPTVSHVLSGANGQNWPEPTVNFDRGGRSEMTGGNGQICPADGAPTAKIDRWPRSKMTGGPGQKRPVASVKTDRGARSEVAGVKETPLGDRRGGDMEGGVPPSPEAALEADLAAWRADQVEAFPSRREKLKAKLVAQRQGMQASAARSLVDRKIAILTALLDGPSVPYAPMPPVVGTAAPVAAPPPPPTREQLIDGARYLVSIGKEASMGEVQRQAWIEETQQESGARSQAGKKKGSR